MSAAEAAGRPRLVATLRALVAHPGALTRSRLDGRSQRYVPLTTLLVSCAAAFFVLTTVLSHRPTNDAAAKSCATAPGGDGGLDSALGPLLGLAADQPAAAPASPAEFWLLHAVEQLLCDPQRFTYALGLAVPIAFLVLIPAFAGLMHLAFRRELPGYAGHWTYAVESHAALFLVLSALAVVSALGSSFLSFFASLGGLVYTTWNLHAGVQTTYRVTSRTATWRTTLVGVAYALLLVAAVGVTLWILL
ncbi:MAG TPA: hypothetical protein VNE60_01070 [Gemmatimonadaceae bacterium]|nr:hypothetical protein [Gemmatimonadaceae bacterium]